MAYQEVLKMRNLKRRVLKNRNKKKKKKIMGYVTRRKLTILMYKNCAKRSKKKMKNWKKKLNR